MKAFICMVEIYDGERIPWRIFADTKEEARKKLIEQFPQCYVSEAITTAEYDIEKNSRNSKDDDTKMTNEVEQAIRQGYAQAKKEATEALEKLKEKINDEYCKAVNDAQYYYNPDVAQDALEDVYDKVEYWIKINKIFNGNEEVQNENDKSTIQETLGQ